MADDRVPGREGPMTEAERLRLQALADKRNQALDTVSNLVNKQDAVRRDIVGKMR